MAVVQQKITDNYAIYHGDCIAVMADMPAGSAHLSVYSPPFGGLYNYTSDDRDLSNCKDEDEFFDHYRFVVRGLCRVTMAGRISAVHCVDIKHGRKLIDFPGKVIRLHEEEGWDFIARHFVWKEPLMVRNRTMAQGLAHRQVVDDGTLCDNAAADHLLIFRKRGTNPIPVAHPRGLTNYAGERGMPAEARECEGFTGKQTQNRYSHWIWRQYASAFWDDIRTGRVLPFKGARDENDEKHVHPLMLDVIERIVILRSNEGEVVLTPFMGVGSEVYGAVIHGRKGVGVELKESYYRQAERNLEAAANNWRDNQEQKELFA